MDTFNQLWADYSPMAIDLALALAILLAFYIGASLVRSLIRKGMKKTTLDNRFIQTVGLKEDFPIENVVAGTAFWVLMTYGLLMFLDKLNLETVAQPITRFLTEIFEYLPKIGAALGLMVLAWVLASLVKIGIAKLAGVFSVDERLQKLDTDTESNTGSSTDADANDSKQQEFTIAESLATAGYWFVFLMFLPVILGTLGMQSLVEPLQDMFSKVFTFLPNILSALIVFLIGSFVARIVRKVVSSLLAATGVDGFSERVGLKSSISGLIGTLSFTVILLLVIVQALDSLQVEAVSAPAREMINLMFLAVPGLISAGLVIGISWYVGKLVAGLISDLLTASNFNSITEKVGLGSDLKKTPSEYVGGLVLLGIILFAVLGATELIGFEPLGIIVANLIDFTFSVVLGAVVLGLGIMVANKVYELVLALNPAAANLARIAILVLTGAMALRQIGVADDIISMAFGITLGAIGIGAALAIGLGSKELAGREVEGFVNKLRGK